MKNYLAHFMQEQGLSIADLCKKCKVPTWRIKLIMEGENEPLLSEARKISKALNVDMSLIFPE